MASEPLCHCLIGPPASGKSTLAQGMQTLWPQSRLVSTDRIRHQLYGDASIQGEWAEIQAVVLAQMGEALAQGQGVIYDATNAKRVWRMDFLQRVAPLGGRWLGWRLMTPLATCHQWNRQRDRAIPAAVIDHLYAALQRFPPLAAEGFLAVYALNSNYALARLEARLQYLERCLIGRHNRTQKLQWHRYSALLDFDRLMHLISLLVQQPGLGHLQSHDPERLQALLESPLPTLATSLDEVTAVVAQRCGRLYADPQALAQDLEWLEANGLLSPTPTDTPLTLPPTAQSQVNPHPYSDWGPFQRLITVIRLMVHHPLCWQPESGSSLESVVSALQGRGLLTSDRQRAVRKDIEQVLKPFGILPPFRMDFRLWERG